MDAGFGARPLADRHRRGRARRLRPRAGVGLLGPPVRRLPLDRADLRLRGEGGDASVRGRRQPARGARRRAADPGGVRDPAAARAARLRGRGGSPLLASRRHRRVADLPSHARLRSARVRPRRGKLDHAAARRQHVRPDRRSAGDLRPAEAAGDEGRVLARGCVHEDGDPRGLHQPDQLRRRVRGAERRPALLRQGRIPAHPPGSGAAGGPPAGARPLLAHSPPGSRAAPAQPRARPDGRPGHDH